MKKWSLSMVLSVLFAIALAMPAVAADTLVIYYKNGKVQSIDLGSVAKIEFAGGTSASSGLESGRTYEMSAKHSGKCLDVSGASNNTGANIYQWDCHGGPNQRWTLTDKGGGYYTVTAQHSGKCMDVEGAGQGNGANVYQWDCHSGPNQLWMFIPQGGGYYLVTAKHSGKCLDVSGVSKDTGANVYQWDCHGGPNQLWKLK